MTERFKKLFTLEPNLYTENSPVIISAGALQFDNETGKILAQIKFKNISNKNIKCISVSIQQLDTIGRTLGEPILYQYLDLDINRDIEFGSKTPIYLSDQTARSFKIEITEIIFKDDTIWSPTKESIWESIPEQNKLYPNDSELLDQYHLDINPKGEKEFFKYKDIWKCSCGAINKENENSCHTCHFPLNKMENVNTEILMTSLQKRKEQEKLHEELSKKEEQYKKACSLMKIHTISSYESAMNLLKTLGEYKDSKEKIKICENELNLLKKQSDEKKSKTKKILAIVGCVILTLIICGSLYNTLIKPKITYEKAVTALKAKDYDTAMDLFDDLGDYKDSQTKLRKAKTKLQRAKYKQKLQENYEKAIKQFKSGSYYYDTISLLKNHIDYKDSLYYLIRSYYETGNYDKVLELKSLYKGNKLDDIFNDSEIKLAEKESKSIHEYLESGNIEQAESTLKNCDDATKNTYQPIIDKIKSENCIGTYKGDKGTIEISYTLNDDNSYTYNVTLKSNNTKTSGSYSTQSVEDQTLSNFTDCNEMVLCDYDQEAPAFFTRGKSYNIYRAKFQYRYVLKKNGDNLDLITNSKCISVDSGAPYSAGDILESTEQYVRQ